MARKKSVSNVSAAVEDVHERIRTGTPRPNVIPSPLSREHLDALNQVIQECTITQDMCEKCMEAGIDLEPEVRANAEQLKMATILKQTFYPNMS